MGVVCGNWGQGEGDTNRIIEIKVKKSVHLNYKLRTSNYKVKEKIVQNVQKV
jgi:hypothetical protein